MLKHRTLRLSTALVALAGLSTACTSDPVDPAGDGPLVDDPAALLSVHPSSGSMDVSVDDSVVVTFSHAIAQGMEAYVDLHEGSLMGPEVDGAWSRSADGTRLIFHPANALEPATTYVIHLGGGMMGENGEAVNFEMHGQAMGGTWATQSMMGGGTMGGQMGTHMGSGWQNPANGYYGMIFTFTTEGAPDPTAFLSVHPASGSVDVSVDDSVVVTFSHAVAQGMEEYVDLHEGSLMGPEVDGAWSRSADGTRLIFHPAASLKTGTTYVIHLGGGMMGEDGGGVDFGTHGETMGGTWATQTMMGGGTMGGQMGTHMGAGWQNPSNGYYGMIFTFTTEGAPDPTTLVGVHPAGGAVDVSVNDSVVVTFSQAVAEGMEEYADLHQDSLAGPEVAGAWSRSADGTQLIFRPASPLEPATTYVIHLGGGMMGEDGKAVNFEMHGQTMGGTWATQTMMGGGQMGTHMGAGWQNPSNGYYGMIFTFTTEG